MSFRLSYPDRFRLWSDIVRASADRVFVPTDEVARIGARIAVDLELPERPEPIVMRGTVVGRRPGSERFVAGVYVRFAEEEIEKCRQYLGLGPAPDDPERSGPRRVHCELKVKFLEPLHEELCVARSLSEAGMLVTAPFVPPAGQKLRLSLRLDDGSDVQLRGEVSWLGHEGGPVGVRFVDPTPEAVEAVAAAIRRIDQGAQGVSEPPQPVVVADDDPDILVFLTKALTKSGYDVYQARNGKEALGLVRELQPRLVVLDLLMPGIDGVEVCKRMRSEPDLADTPVIFVSALDAASLHQVADEAGATDYLSKPVGFSALISMVGRYLRPG